VATRTAEHKEPGVFGDKMLLALLVRFLICFAALFAIMVWVDARTHLLTDLELATTAAATALMNLTGVVARATGTVIFVPGRILSIGPDCTGVSIAALLVSLVVAYPVKISSKVVGVVAGVVAILLANLVRLVAIAHLSLAPAQVFDTAHDFLFQVGMVVVAVAVWAYWLSFVRARES